MFALWPSTCATRYAGYVANGLMRLRSYGRSVYEEPRSRICSSSFAKRSDINSELPKISRISLTYRPGKEWVVKSGTLVSIEGKRSSCQANDTCQTTIPRPGPNSNLLPVSYALTTNSVRCGLPERDDIGIYNGVSSFALYGGAEHDGSDVCDGVNRFALYVEPEHIAVVAA